MSAAMVRSISLVSILFLSLAGCGRNQNGATDADLSDLKEGKPASVAASETSPAVTPPPLEGTIELKLNVKEPFPLSKSVEQRLVESDSQGTISVSTSRTEMLLSLNVDEVYSDGRKKMTVTYHKVAYEQDVRGSRASYSSANPVEPIPRAALPYSGMANNGFSFIVGPNNKIVELIGFNEFLQRCLKSVPTADVASVRQRLESTKNEEIATFIDDSIGLLPYSNDPQHPIVALKEGTSWELEPQRSENPVPMLVRTTCTLNDLTQNSAEILLAGKIIGPPDPVPMRTAEGTIKVLVKGGFSTGSCRVDRKTGLPTQSRIQRRLEMTMELPNGEKVEQLKETLSTVRSFLVSPRPSPDPQIEQTRFQQTPGSEQQSRVQRAAGTPGN